jgi:hypothetical protein
MGAWIGGTHCICRKMGIAKPQYTSQFIESVARRKMFVLKIILLSQGPLFILIVRKPLFRCRIVLRSHCCSTYTVDDSEMGLPVLLFAPRSRGEGNPSVRSPIKLLNDHLNYYVGVHQNPHCFTT